MNTGANPHPRRFDLLGTMVFHIRPHRVPEKTLRFTLTWGLGGMATVLVLLQLFTGILLKFAYGSVPTQAYDSLVRLQEGFLFGQLVRSVHFWSGAGGLLASADFTIAAKGTFSLNTASLPALSGRSGSITVAHDGSYGALSGKAVSLEPATGFSFDSPLVWKPVR